MRIFYKTLLCFSAVLITLVSCSFDEMGDQFTLENTKINIAFDREKFDFQKMHEINELSPIKIGDSLTVDAVNDTSTLEFTDLKIEEKTETYNIPSTTSYPSGVQIPPFDYTVTKENIPYENPDQTQPEQKFDWAKIDTGKFSIDIYNSYAQIYFKSIHFTLTNKWNETVFVDSINNLDIGSSGTTGPISLNQKMITNNMKLKTRIKTQAVAASQNSQGMSTSDYLMFTYKLSESSFDSAYATFNTQKVISDSLHQMDISDMIAKKISLKNGEVRFNAINNSAFKLDMRFAIDSLQNPSTGERYYKKFSVEPYGSNLVYAPIDKWTLGIETSNNQQGVLLKDTTYCRSGSSDPNAMVKYHKTDKAYFITSFCKWDPQHIKKDPVQAYWVDGKMDHKALEINKEAKAVSGDIDWSDFEGIHADSLQAKLNLNVGRDDLKLQEIKFEDFKIQGRKTLANGGTQSAWYPLTIPTMTNVNDTSVFIAGLENVINFHPDTLVYSGKAITTFDGKLYDYDSINIDLGFGVPLQVQATVPLGQVALTQSADVDSLDAINDNENMDIEAVKIDLDAFINNPKAIDAKMRLTVKISDQIVKTFDAENDSLAGNVDTLMTAILQKDYNGSTSYMISNLQGGKPVELKKEAITQMLKNKTYIQQTLEVISQGPGHPIIMKPSDFIEVQLKLSGDLNITFETK